MPTRVFVAIDLPASARDLLERGLADFLEADPSWRGEKAVAARLFHVTLAFLGGVPDPVLPDLVERLRHATALASPFRLRVDGFRAVPSLRRATMLWATLSGDGGGAPALAQAVARAAGLPEDGRRFQAHVTLVRARGNRPVRSSAVAAALAVLSDAGKETDGVVSVRSVTVFSSTLGSGGPAYEPLAVLELGGSAAGLAAD